VQIKSDRIGSCSRALTTAFLAEWSSRLRRR
jgi:hypothetical protein